MLCNVMQFNMMLRVTFSSAIIGSDESSEAMLLDRFKGLLPLFSLILPLTALALALAAAAAAEDDDEESAALLESLA